MAVARRTRDPDLELAALGRAGLAEIALGRIEEGMTRFDEGMAASAAGEAADLRTIGDLYCAANLAAEITLDVSRFEQWTGVVMGFMGRTGHPDLLTFCGTCCAEVLLAAGQWEDGEGWLTRTLSQLEKSGQKARSHQIYHPSRVWTLRPTTIQTRISIPNASNPSTTHPSCAWYRSNEPDFRTV